MTTNNLMREYKAIYQRNSNPNPEKSFRAWHKDAVLNRKALSAVDALYNTERQKIISTYAPEKAKQMILDLDSNYAEARRTAVKDLEDKLNAVAESKREALRKANKAPSTEDINLLSALKMRTRLSEDEIVRAAESMSDNLVSLATLADIANSAGIHLAIPTAEKPEEDIDKAVQFSESMMKDLMTPDNKLSYKAIEFYNYPDGSFGYAFEAFRDLDESPFTAEQIREHIETRRVNLKAYTAPDANAAEVELRGSETIPNIALQFGVRYSDIEKANPDKDLSNLHAGDRIVVPSRRMKLTAGTGFVSPDQVSPVQLQTSSLDPDIHHSMGQAKTASLASANSEGSAINIPSV